MRIAIVENEEKEISKYLEFIRKYENEVKEKIEVDTFNNGFDFFENYKCDYNCVFMDIDMPGINGLETSIKLRTLDQDVIIIFVTNLPQFAIDGYKVQALDFLLKPLDYINFKVELNKVNRFCKSVSPKKSLWINLKSGNYKIPFNEIIYIEIIRHDVVIHTTETEYKFRGTLTSIEEKLDKDLFIRIGSPFIVNLAYVIGVNKGECILQNDVRLTISRQNKSKFMEALNSYLNFDVE